MESDRVVISRFPSTIQAAQSGDLGARRVRRRTGGRVFSCIDVSGPVEDDDLWSDYAYLIRMILAVSSEGMQ